MDDHPHSPPAERVVDSVARNAWGEALDALGAALEAPAEKRKATVRALRTLVEDDPAAVGEAATAVAQFLGDEEQSVRLTTAKLFVELAEAEPSVVVPVVPSLADRLSDDEEFYFVRARCAEALGYVALDRPDAVADPETLADFRVGLSFEKPEVTEKLAKGLEYVAVGDPSRLRHHVSALAEHLDDENELVRYHLCTALVAVGCEHPTRLAPAVKPLRERLGDEDPYVRGRAAEALGLLGASESDAELVSDIGRVEHGADDPPTFLTDRLAFLREQIDPDTPGERREGVGTVRSVRDGTGDVVEAMNAPVDDACPHCGLGLPEGGPPACPQCGAPR
jgi:HEAT repeat protein